MIAVAILAGRPMARARLEALVGARSGMKLVPFARGGAAPSDSETAVGVEVLVIDPAGRPAEVMLRPLSRVATLPPSVLLADEIGSAAFARLLRSGVRGVLPVDATAPEIAAAIEAVAAGLVVLHPSAPPVSVSRPTGTRRPGGETGIDQLTPRELEILTMIAEGLGNRAIAQRLGISTHTVKFHIASTLDKLGARSRTEAVTIAVRRGALMV